MPKPTYFHISGLFFVGAVMAAVSATEGQTRLNLHLTHIGSALYNFGAEPQVLERKKAHTGDQFQVGFKLDVCEQHTANLYGSII
jgi:hypothetical protein